MLYDLTHTLAVNVDQVSPGPFFSDTELLQILVKFSTWYLENLCVCGWGMGGRAYLAPLKGYHFSCTSESETYPYFYPPDHIETFNQG